MENNQSSTNLIPPKFKSNKISRGITIKVLILLVMLLVMQIPVIMIRGLIEDRQNSDIESNARTASSWGSGVILSQPKVSIDTLSYPHDLNLSVKIHPQELKRGIYITRVYSAAVKYTFKFNEPTAEIVNLKGQPITIFEVSTLQHKVKSPVTITLNGKSVDNTNQNSSITQGVIRFCIDNKYIPKKGDIVEVTYSTIGSDELTFFGFSNSAIIDVNSTWASPNFKGTLLPDNRNVSADGFTAQWIIPSGVSSSEDIFGVELIKPVDHYRLTDRATKYALLFIALTFLAFFIAETVNKWRIHPMQYALVGAAMVVFYSLLLSFSEQVGFTIAYLISSVATILLISSYAITILRKNIRSAIGIGILLTVLYLFLYFILQMEVYALMAGSILLFATVAAAMFCLRNVKWYGENE